jgi:hypothetical protein
VQAAGLKAKRPPPGGRRRRSFLYSPELSLALAWLTSPVRCQLPGAPATGCDGWLAHRPLRPLPPGAPAVPQGAS